MEEYIRLIFEILGSLIAGGGVGAIVSWRYIKRREKTITEREEATTNGTQLENVDKIVQLYKEALDDLSKRKEESDQSYIDKISEYERKVAELDSKLQQYKEDLDAKNSLISDLTKSQLAFKLELDMLKKASLSDCTDCDFKTNCEKYKAKQLKYELSNG
jgi:predicted RNase H-like nuclease (RuvC/YqgF family)